MMSEQSADSNDARVKTLSGAATEDKLHCIHELEGCQKEVALRGREQGDKTSDGWHLHGAFMRDI